MTYIPISPKERDAMLETIGVRSLDDLFDAVPAKHRFPKLNLPPALTEMEAMDELSGLAQANENVREDLVSFLGAGMYNHYIPSVVDHILRRGEFYTAYTPYQPEISQGTLQAIFEYQSLMAALTGMDVSNASHYDGATATAEAVNLAYAQFRGKRRKVVISPTVHPQYRAVIRTYSRAWNWSWPAMTRTRISIRIPMTSPTSSTTDTALVIVQYPDFFGRIYDYTKLHRRRCMRRERWSVSWPTPPRWACSRLPARWARISSWAKASRSASRCGTADPAWLLHDPQEHTSTRWPDAWSAKPSITAASAPTS